MEIKIFLMRTGQEVIAEIISREKKLKEIKIKNPVMLIQLPGTDNPQMVGYAQTSCGNVKTNNEIKDRSFTFTKEMYFCEVLPMSYVKKSYEQNFGAGIVIPEQTIVSAS